MRRPARRIVRLGNLIGRPPEGRSLREALSVNGIQEVSGSIPLISTKSSEEARKTLKSLDFKVFSYPKVGKSQHSLFAPVRLIFEGNFENQEVRYYEEN